MKKLLLVEAAHGKVSLGNSSLGSRRKKEPPDCHIFDAPVIDGEIEDFAIISELLQEYIQRHNLKQAKVKLALRTSKSIVRIAKIPPVRPKDQDVFIRTQLADLLSIDLQEYIADYRVLHKTKEETILLLAALNRDVSEAYSQWLETLKLEPSCIDLSINAAAMYISKYQATNVLLVVEYMKKISLLLLSAEYECVDIYMSDMSNISNKSKAIEDVMQFISFIQGRFEKVFIIANSDWLKAVFSVYEVEQLTEGSILHGLVLEG